MTKRFLVTSLGIGFLLSVSLACSLSEKTIGPGPPPRDATTDAQPSATSTSIPTTTPIPTSTPTPQPTPTPTPHGDIAYLSNDGSVWLIDIQNENSAIQLSSRTSNALYNLDLRWSSDGNTLAIYRGDIDILEIVHPEEPERDSAIRMGDWMGWGWGEEETSIVFALREGEVREIGLDGSGDRVIGRIQIPEGEELLSFHLSPNASAAAMNFILHFGQGPLPFPWPMVLTYDMTSYSTTDVPAGNYDWSPDGRYIAFDQMADMIGYMGPIGVYDTQTGEITYLNDDAIVAEHHPLWSPDRETLAFVVSPLDFERLNPGYVWISDMSGDHRRALAGPEGEQVSWSPDANYLIIATSEDDTLRRLFVADAIGNDAWFLVDGYTATWRP